MERSAGAYRCVALDHVGFGLSATPGLIEQVRKKYTALLRHYARQAAGLSIPLTMPAPLAQAA